MVEGAVEVDEGFGPEEDAERSLLEVVFCFSKDLDEGPEERIVTLYNSG